MPRVIWIALAWLAITAGCHDAPTMVCASGQETVIRVEASNGVGETS